MSHPAAQAQPQIATLLETQAAFSALSAQARETLAAQWQASPMASGDTLLAAGELPTRLGMVLSGAVDLQDPDLDRAVTLKAGALFGFGATPWAHLSSWQATAAADGSVAWLAPAALQQLCAAQPELEYHFPSLSPPAAARGQPAAHTAPATDDGMPLNRLATPLRALIKRAPVCLAPATPVHEVAAHMRSQRVSSVLLTETDGSLMGVVTDRDLRNRVLAVGMDSHQPVRAIATLAPHTLQAASPAFDALLLMARANIHHVPVMEGAQVVGMVTATDLAEQQNTSAVVLAGEIHKQSSVDALAHTATRLKTLQRHLAEAGTSAYGTGHIVTAMTDAITVRLIELAHARMGAAPVEYVWVAAGSQARSEQTAKSDQDNCLVLSDDYNAAQHGDWFRDFSRFVCDGLDACGYVHCPGDMMAMTDQWRQPRARWQEYFRQWVDTPEPMALMLTCVFFDLRAIHGKAELLDSLRHEVLTRTQGNSLFLSHMVGNALKHRPPLGMFGSITQIRGGEHAGKVDLKHSGVVPIVDLARLFALAGAEPAVNTQDRLDAAGAAGDLNPGTARDMREALEFIASLRIQHQARQLAQGLAPDHHVPLLELSNFERSQLKQAFGVVQTVQSVLAQRYR